VESAGEGLRADRERAMLCVAHETLARRGELVTLERRDLEFHPDGTGQALIRRGKTDAEGQGRIAYLSRQTVRWLKVWLEHADISEGAVFRRLIGRKQVGGALNPESIAPIFKRMAQWIGMPARVVSRVSGHSTRVGATQDLAALDIDLAAITQAGGWKSRECHCGMPRGSAQQDLGWQEPPLSPAVTKRFQNKRPNFHQLASCLLRTNRGANARPRHIFICYKKRHRTLQDHDVTDQKNETERTFRFKIPMSSEILTVDVGVLESRTFEGDPKTWKLDDLVTSAAMGRDAAVLNDVARRRAQLLIGSRQRIHAGRMLSEHPGGPPDIRPEEAREARETADLVVRAILDWLTQHPASS
jgi:hypothetical protein